MIFQCIILYPDCSPGSIFHTDCQSYQTISTFAPFSSLTFTPCSFSLILLNISNRNKSGLPFYDVIMCDDIRGAALPVVTLQQAKVRLMDGRWDFDYLYFTESDQVLSSKLSINAHMGCSKSVAIQVNSALKATSYTLRGPMRL